MRDARRWAKTAWRAGALCLLWAGAALAQADAGGKPRGVKLASAGFWTLGLVKMEGGASMCVASTRDGAADAFFDYVVIDRTVTAFRVAGVPVLAAGDAEDALYILQVDGRKPVAINGRRDDGVALLPVDKDADAKRQFVRDLAEGDRLSVRDGTGAMIGRFPLMGAEKVLRAFGLCVARMPRRAQ